MATGFGMRPYCRFLAIDLSDGQVVAIGVGVVGEDIARYVMLMYRELQDI
jgi:hypothetical protein